MNQLDIFGTKIHEYLLVIEPDSKTIGKIIAIRELLSRTIPLSKDSLQSKPHISLCYFEANDFSDELILSRMKQVISSIKPFEIFLIGCEKWKNGTFILQVDQNEPIQNLQRELSAVFKGVIKTPHLTIIRNLPQRFLNQLSLSDYHYDGSFTCESVLLLKRSGNEPYHILGKIDLSEL
nr:2'-5' RNA ligase family protein [uncultured Fluviicola sp.]